MSGTTTAGEFATVDLRVHRRVSTPRSGGFLALLEELGMYTSAQEGFWVVTYDAERNLRKVVEIGRGAYHEILVSIPAILTSVLLSGTDRFVVVHNHPSGNVEPSSVDIDLTHKVMNAANQVGLYFEDHVIIGSGGEHLSMTERGLIKPSYPKMPKVSKGRASTTVRVIHAEEYVQD